MSNAHQWERVCLPVDADLWSTCKGLLETCGSNAPEQLLTALLANDVRETLEELSATRGESRSGDGLRALLAEVMTTGRCSEEGVAS